MKIASIVSILALLFAPAIVQQTEPSTDVAVKIPREHTPSYYCLITYFESRAYGHLSGNHFHQVLDELSIPHSSPLKDRLIQLTLLANDNYNKSMPWKHLPKDDEAAWNAEQDAFIEGQMTSVKTLYDTFLDEVEEEGLDSEEINDTMVREGRKMTSITVIGDHIDDKLIDLLNQFESPGNNNPWLVKRQEDPTND